MARSISLVQNGQNHVQASQVQASHNRVQSSYIQNGQSHVQASQDQAGPSHVQSVQASDSNAQSVQGASRLYDIFITTSSYFQHEFVDGFASASTNKSFLI